MKVQDWCFFPRNTLSNSQGANVVNNDFYLATAADIVADPSAPDAFVEHYGRQRMGLG